MEFYKNHMFAILNDYRYKIKSLGTIKYGILKIYLVNKK